MPTEQVTKDFLKQVVNEDKELLHTTEVKWVNVPQYDELSVKSLWPEVSKQKEVMRYMPDKQRKGQQISRAYFFNVLNTVMPAYVDKLLRHANNKRMDAGIADPKRDFIELSDAWYKKLMAFPFISRKFFALLLPFRAESKGCTVHLLKSRSKPSSSTRKRRKIEKACTIEQFRQGDGPKDACMESTMQSMNLN